MEYIIPVLKKLLVKEKECVRKERKERREGGKKKKERKKNPTQFIPMVLT